MPLILPYPGKPANGDALDGAPIAANFAAIAQAIQSFDGSQVQSGTIAASALAPAANPVTRGAETIANFIYSGLVVGNTAGLSITISGGVIYINGIRIVFSGVGSQTLLASRDYYIDVDYLGNVYYQNVANNATAPSLTANSVRIAKVVTGASVVGVITQSGVDTNYTPISPASPITLLSNIFGRSAQVYSNPGAGGGTFYYLNLGGIKLFWGTTASNAVGVGGASLTITLPPSFFSSLQYVNPSVAAVTVEAKQWAYLPSAPTTSSVPVSIISNSNGATQTTNLLIIGA